MVQAETIFTRLYSPLILIMVVVQQRRQAETNIALQNILEAFLNRKLDDNFDIIFLLKVCCSSPLFFDKVLFHVTPLCELLSNCHLLYIFVQFLVTQQSIIQLCSILKDPNYPLIRNGNVSVFECLTAAVYRFSPLISIEFLEMLQIMAFNASIFENASNLDFVQQNLVREALKIVCVSYS